MNLCVGGWFSAAFDENIFNFFCGASVRFAFFSFHFIPFHYVQALVSAMKWKLKLDVMSIIELYHLFNVLRFLIHIFFFIIPLGDPFGSSNIDFTNNIVVTFSHSVFSLLLFLLLICTLVPYLRCKVYVYKSTVLMDSLPEKVSTSFIGFNVLYFCISFVFA